MTDATKLADELDAIFDRIEVSCDWRLSSEERETIAKAAIALRTPAVPTTEPVAAMVSEDDISTLEALAMIEEFGSFHATLNRVVTVLRAPPVAAPEDAVREALRTAIGHIEHMAAWIKKANSDYHVGVYSFESLGEDLPGIRAALPAKDGAGSQVTRPQGNTP